MTCPATPSGWNAYARRWPRSSPASDIFAGRSVARASGSPPTTPMPNGTSAPGRAAWPRRRVTGSASPGCEPPNRACAPARRPSGRPRKRSSPASRKPGGASRTPPRPFRRHGGPATTSTTGAYARRRRRSACMRIWPTRRRRSSRPVAPCAVRSAGPRWCGAPDWTAPHCPRTWWTIPVRTSAAVCGRCGRWPTRYNRPSAARGTRCRTALCSTGTPTCATNWRAVTTRSWRSATGSRCAA